MKMDDEIQETVESILGKGVKVVDCEKKSCVREEEVLLVNGCPIALEGEDGAAIREALLHGTVPHCDLLNQILIRAGILRAPVRLETSLSVKSTVVTREEVTVARGGRVVDERSRETKEDNYYTSSSSEVWEPTVVSSQQPASQQYVIPLSPRQYYRPTVLRGGAATTPTSCCSQPQQPDCAPRVQTTSSAPTICGPATVADHGSKIGTNTRSLPQTPQTGKGYGNILNGAAAHHGPSTQSLEASCGPSSDLVCRDGNLLSGSLQALVQHMVPTEEYYPDPVFLFAFLLSSRLFIKPHELLGEISAMYDAQHKLQEKHGTAKGEAGRFVPHLVKLLAEWTETFPYDFRDERVMAHVRSITQKCVTADPAIRKDVSSLLQKLLQRLTRLEQYEEFLQGVSSDSSASCMDGLSVIDVTELCSSPGLLAQQLTHIELERLSYIGPEEFVQSFAKENAHVETSFKEKKTRNLESYVQWFNRLSYLVATEVCKHVKKKQRVKVMEYWIETARECFNIGNFNSLMAIIAGLNMSPVSRLKKTWSKVQSAKFSILEHQMDPSCNFSSYRSTLKAAMWRSAGATDQRQRIVIPFFSLLLKDLYFLNEGCSNRLSNGHINFEKFWQLAKQVTEFIAWKEVTCPFEKNPKVITFLQTSPLLTENALALASFECEPPDNNHEKERYKSLKMEHSS